MIFDKVCNLEKYGIGFLKSVTEYIKKTDLTSAESGMVELDGKNLTVNIVDRVLEKEATVWESHKKYIDVHVMISGNEKICYAAEDELTKTNDYDEAKDCTLYSGNPSDKICYELSAEDVMIFLPGEIHLTNGPCNSISAKKAIFKVLFN